MSLKLDSIIALEFCRGTRTVIRTVYVPPPDLSAPPEKSRKRIHASTSIAEFRVRSDSCLSYDTAAEMSERIVLREAQHESLIVVSLRHIRLVGSTWTQTAPTL